MSLTILELIRRATDFLKGKGIADPRLDSELLLAGVLGYKRLDLYLQFDRVLGEEQVAVFREAVRRRARREPLQYIAGFAEFRELKLEVDARVLIPRPETEVLVGEVLKWAAELPAPTALDIGTGSGAIALSLAKEGNFEKVVAVDVSEDALDVARHNQKRLLPEATIDFCQGSLFEGVGEQRFDVVVSNPPYVGEIERDSLEAEVRNFEPGLALFSGENGLDLITELVRQAPGHLNPGGLLALEVGATQAGNVSRLLSDTNEFSDIRIRRDLAGRERIVLATRV